MAAAKYYYVIYYNEVVVSADSTLYSAQPGIYDGSYIGDELEVTHDGNNIRLNDYYTTDARPPVYVKYGSNYYFVEGSPRTTAQTLVELTNLTPIPVKYLDKLVLNLESVGVSTEYELHDARIADIDSTPTANSTNLVTSGGVAGALAGKQDTIDASHKLDYGLLSNTPTIPAAQVNSDWNASSGVAQILNKPTIPPNKTLVLTDIPEDGIGCYWLDPDWTYCSWDELGDAFEGKYEAIYIHTEAYYDEDAQEYRKERYITAPIRLSSDYYEVGSDYIEFDIRGEVTTDIMTCCIELGPNSYIQVSHRRAVPPLSTNIVQDKTSNIKTATPKAVYDEVHPAVQSTQPQGGFLPNVEYNLGTLTGNVTFALAAAVSGIPNKWYWCFKAGSTAPTITWPTGLLWPEPDAEPPTIEANDEVEVEVKNGHIVALVFKPTS